MPLAGHEAKTAEDSWGYGAVQRHDMDLLREM